MAYLGVNTYSYNSGVTYSKGDPVADATAVTYGTVGSASAGAGQLTYTSSSGTPVVGMVISAANALGISSGTVITSVSGAGPYTIGLNQPLSTAIPASTKVTARTYWISTTDNNTGNTPSTSSSYWSATNSWASVTPLVNQIGVPGVTWVIGDKSITTDTIKTETHDRFTGTVFHTGSDAGTLYIQQSPDGKNWDHIPASGATGYVATVAMNIQTPYGTLAGYGAKFSDEVVAPYIRFQFVYGTTLPTVFRLNGRSANSGVKF